MKCVLFQLINYFIVSIYKVYILYLLYTLLYTQTQINLLIRNLVLSCPLPPLFIILAVFEIVYENHKNFSTFFVKNNGCHPNSLSNSHLKILKVLKEKCSFISYQRSAYIA